MKEIDIALERGRNAWSSLLKDYADEFGRVNLPTFSMLSERHLENSRLISDRNLILDRMRVGGVCTELGVQSGRFTRQILTRCRPAKLHLIDINLLEFEIKELFQPEIQAGVIHLHEGDSSTILATFPDQHFDFVYIDGDHRYQGVTRNIKVAKHKVKERGYLIFNNYTYWSPCESMRYGVMQAVNELCIQEDWEVVYLALAHYMYCDIAIRRK
jgi:hypothetical protein